MMPLSAWPVPPFRYILSILYLVHFIHGGKHQPDASLRLTCATYTFSKKNVHFIQAGWKARGGCLSQRDPCHLYAIFCWYILYMVLKHIFVSNSGCLSQRDPCHLFAIFYLVHFILYTFKTYISNNNVHFIQGGKRMPLPAWPVPPFCSSPSPTLSAPAKAANVSSRNYINGNLYQWKLYQWKLYQWKLYQ